MTAPAARAADIYVGQGGDLQAAIDRAQPGDRILLQPGATFVGNFRLTDKGASTDYITIRSAASDLLLPPDGVRISPADAVNLPVIKSPSTASAMRTMAGAHHWRLQCLEFQANDRGYGDIISLGAGDTSQTLLSQVPHDLVLDRVYVHGHPVIGQKRGIAVHSGATWILNSYISDIKAVGIDTQAIMGYNGPGPWTFINNYLEATGENFLLGGASPKIQDLVPADIEFRRNYLYKPLAWRDPILPAPLGVSAVPATGGSLPAGTFSYRVLAAVKTAQDSWAYSPRSVEVLAATTDGSRVTLSWAPVPNATTYRIYRGTSAGAQDRYFTSPVTTFVDDGTQAGVADTGASKNGTVWTVKNLFELKLGLRVFVEGNVMENTWLQAQTGYAVLLTPRNQDDTSPWIYMRDVTFIRNIVRHAGSGIALEGYDSNHTCQQSQRIIIRDNLFDDISSQRWGGSGRFIQIGSGPRDVVIDHNTVVHDGPFIYVYGGSLGAEQVVEGAVITNNMAKHNAYGIMGAGHGYGNDTIASYFPDAIVQRNVLAGGNGSKYPAGNEFPTVAYWQSQFVDFALPDYRLLTGSPYTASGTDGRDLGAPVAELYDMAVEAMSGRAGAAPAPAVLQITTQSLATAQVGTAYAATLAASGGSGNYVWSVISGQLPAGLALAPSGAITGTPAAATLATFGVKAVDATNSASFATTALSLQVDAAPLSIVTTALPSGRTGYPYSATLAASGGIAPYTWRVSAGSLPPGLTLAGSGALSGTPTSGGTWSATIAATDASSPGTSTSRTFTVVVSAAPTVTITTPVSGTTVTDTTVPLAASAADSDGSVTRVDFYAGTALVASATAAPWTAAWANAAVGSYSVSAIATDNSGLTGTSAAVTVTVAEPPPATLPPPDGQIVIYTADAARAVGRWSRVADSTAAGGYKLSNADQGLSADPILANPPDYFETTFSAPSGTRYHVWIRMRARNNSWANDSLWMQFSDSVTAAGQPLYQIGTTSGLIRNLEQCNGCGVSGWGWTDNAFWVAQQDVQFASGGTHVVRVQSRQDGAEVDQIVLVPSATGTAAPGPDRNDTTILPRSTDTPSDVVIYAADIPAAALHGRWAIGPSSTSPAGLALYTTDRNNKALNNALASPADYVDVTVPAAKDTPYRVWVRMRAAKNSTNNDSVWMQYSDALVNGTPEYRVGTTSGLPMNLAGCSNCRVSEWGWRDGAYWQPGQPITFSYSGLHTIRIQLREDGAQIDQIVLSPARYLSTPPGAATNDGTFVPRP